jgi:hypothetical protein
VVLQVPEVVLQLLVVRDRQLDRAARFLEPLPQGLELHPVAGERADLGQLVACPAQLVVDAALLDPLLEADDDVFTIASSSLALRIATRSRSAPRPWVPAVAPGLA